MKSPPDGGLFLLQPGLVLELLHLLGQHPQRPIQAHAPVDAAHLTRADATTLNAAARQSTHEGVFLRLC